MNKRTEFKTIAVGAMWVGLFAFEGGLLSASTVGTSAGVNILNDATARASALSGTLGADENDISAFSYNPASLQSLRGSQVAIQHLKGLTDDSLSQISAGVPLKKGVLGASVFYYDGGNFELFDGSTRRNVQAQKDYLLAVGYGKNNGKFDLGFTTKYFRSELLGMFSASTVVVDFGAARRLTSQLRVATSLQNIGKNLTYGSEGENLPKIARASLAYKLHEGASHPEMFYMDIPYHINEKKFELHMGAETMLGALHARIGYRNGIDELGGITVGLGFDIGQAVIDYSVDSNAYLDNTQKVSVTYCFGNSEPTPNSKNAKIFPVEIYPNGLIK